jgi:GntR family transcriptional regulator of arabinose operon
MLKEYIIETIKSEQLSTGDKFYSENELAEKFQISRRTTRQAIGELVNEGWLYRVQGKGTFVNRRPDQKHLGTKTIGVIATYLSDYIFPSIIQGLYNVINEEGYKIILDCTYNMHTKERDCLENLLQQNISGLIVEPTKSALPNPNTDIYKKFGKLGIPVLFIHGCYKELDYSYIVEDDVKAGYLAAKHLMDQGHKNIGGIFKMDDMRGLYRFSGFQKAHLESGFQISDSRILWFETGSMKAKFSTEDVLLESLLSQCTSLVCFNDQVALTVMDTARVRGLNIPEDLSIVSFDDTELARVSPVRITSIAHPKENLGEICGKAIISMIDRTQDYFDLKIKPELIVRESTKIRQEE